MWGCESIAGHGGIFIVPQMVNPLMFLLALAIGSVVTAVSYAILKRPLDQQVDKEEEIIDLDIDIKIQ